MSRVREFKLPDLGEGLTEGEILQWMVKAGDEIRLNQPIVEVETAKAAVEVPSPYAGVVTRIHHEAGEVVDVGSVIISVDTEPTAGPMEAAAEVAAAGAAANPVESAASRSASAVGTREQAEADLLPASVAHAVATDGEEPPAAEDAGIEAGKIGGEAPGGRTAVLVGYGPRSVTATRRPRRTEEPVVPAVTPAPPPATAARVSAAAVGQAAAASAGAAAVLAKPPVRKLAKERGIDLSLLHGSGRGGVVTRADVEAAAAGTPAVAPGVVAPGVVARGADGVAEREHRIPVKGVRKLTAEAMVQSAFTAPHVTEFLTVDVTASMELLPRLRAMPEFAEVKVTPLLLVAKALLLAVGRNPEVNATFSGEEIVVKDYVNLGIAAATPRGLLVPNIPDADTLSLPELAAALQELTATAREGRTTPARMTHGTITITNVGVFGVDTGTPIINPGESAILCFGAVRPTPWVHEGQLAVRQVTQLAVSFDHRNIDGALGSRFLADIGRVLQDPSTALAWS